MAVESHWYQDIFHLYWTDESKSILVLAFENNFKWKDYYELMGIVREMIHGINHPIVYVNVWAEHVKIPSDSPLPHFSNMKSMFLPQAAVVVMHNRWQRTFFEILARAIGFRKNETYWMADSYDEAIAIAQQASYKLLEKFA